jgi:hypothetical protein
MEAHLDRALLGRAAGRLWAEGRHNPITWQVSTTLGSFSTEDRMTWRTASGAWTAELRRSRKGHHWYLALFERGRYRGRYDARGWRDASNRSRVRHLRSSQLPLAA